MRLIALLGFSLTPMTDFTMLSCTSTKLPLFHIHKVWRRYQFYTDYPFLPQKSLNMTQSLKLTRNSSQKLVNRSCNCKHLIYSFDLPNKHQKYFLPVIFCHWSVTCSPWYSSNLWTRWMIFAPAWFARHQFLLSLVEIKFLHSAPKQKACSQAI